MADVEIAVCLRAKQITPATSIRTALRVLSMVVVPDPRRLPISPKLKISSSAPKISPLIPASDSMRLAVSE